MQRVFSKLGDILPAFENTNEINLNSMEERQGNI